LTYNNGNRSSDDGFKILEPLNIKGLLSVKAVISQRFHDFISNSEFLLNEAVNRFKEFVRKSFDFWSSILIGIENIEPAGLGSLIALGEVHVSYLEPFSHNGVDNHGLL
jgi:hypothetical protein